MKNHRLICVNTCLLACLVLVGAWAGPAAAADAPDANPSSADEGRTLEDFFTAAMEHSPRLRIAEDRRDIGEARRRGATGRLLPQVNATATASQNRRDEVGIAPITYRGERYALQLRQVIFDWQAFARRGRAHANENQFEAEYYEELAALFADVAERYFDVLEAQDALDSIEAELRAIRNQSEQVERLYNLQMVPIVDLYDVEARLSTLEAQRLEASSDIILAREALRSASGLNVGPLYELREDTELAPPEGSAQEWAQRAQASSHQIAARQYALEAAEQGVSESRGAYMPRLSLIAQQQRSDLGFDNQPTNRTDVGYIGIDLTIPLFAGGSNRANVSEARSQRNIASNELRQVRLEIGDQARMIFLRLQSNAMRIEAAEKMVEATRVATQSRERSFELGNVTSVELLDAIRDRFRAERDLQALRYEHIKLGLRLSQTAGELDADDLLEVSSWMRPGQ